MKPLEKLHAHHENLIGTIRSLANRAKETPSDSSLLISYCNEYLVSHAEAEEVTLYAADDDASFVNNMILEHQEIKHSLDSIDAAFSKRQTHQLISEVNNFVALLDKHFNEEENTLMPRLAKTHSEEKLNSLISQAHEIEAGKKKSDVWSLFEYDHKRIDFNISNLQNSKDGIEKSKIHYSKIRSQLLKHIELEETILFTAFGEYASPNQMSPVHVMISEHREITSCISTPADLLDPTTLQDNIQALVGKLAVHNKKEELILYPLINRTLPREEKEKIFKGSFTEFERV